MQFHKPLIFSFILAGTAGEAAAWQHETDRGVDLYRTGSGEIAVSLVCDPRSVYGTTESAVLIEVGDDQDHSGEMEFRFPDATVVKAPLIHGRFGMAGNDGSLWRSLLTGLRAHDTVSVTVGGQSFDVTLGEPMPFTCT